MPTTHPRYDLEIELREQSAPVREIYPTGHDRWGAPIRYEHTGERYHTWEILYNGVAIGTIHGSRAHKDSTWHASITKENEADYLPAPYHQQLAEFGEFLEADFFHAR